MNAASISKMLNNAARNTRRAKAAKVPPPLRLSRSTVKRHSRKLTGSKLRPSTAKNTMYTDEELRKLKNDNLPVNYSRMNHARFMKFLSML